MEEMLDQAVYISEQGRVSLLADTRLVWSFTDFTNLTAASVLPAEGKKNPVRVALVWLQHPHRVTVSARTFHAGVDRICLDPHGRTAINTWQEPYRLIPPDNWLARATPFVDHIHYLAPAQAEAEYLLDWLAHIEQRPGELPHVHILMVTPEH